jgi:branched-chain amino acid transport system substrate-binding protein
MPTVEQDQLPVVGPPQTIDIQLENPYVFNNMAHYSDQADVAVEYMINELGDAADLNVVVIQLELPSGDEWNMYVRRRLEDRGGNYVDRITMNPGSPDYPGIVTRLQQYVNNGANYVALAGAPSHGLGILTEMGRLGFEVPIIGIHGIAGTTIYEEGPQNLLHLVHGIHSFLPAVADCELCATIREFVQGTRWEDGPNHLNFSHGWLDIYLLVQAIECAAGTGELTRATLHEALQGEFDTGGISCPHDWSTSNHSPCAAPVEWDGEHLGIVGTFEEWSGVFQGEYRLFEG